MGPSRILQPAWVPLPLPRAISTPGTAVLLLANSRARASTSHGSGAGARSSPSPPYPRRHYAKAAAGAAGNGKPIVLEPPSKFNPPSHPARRGGWNMPKMYGPKMTEGERAQQERQNYPGLMAPAGTWEHWFWHSSVVHMCLTIVCSFFPLFCSLSFPQDFEKCFLALRDAKADMCLLMSAGHTGRARDQHLHHKLQVYVSVPARTPAQRPLLDEPVRLLWRLGACHEAA